MSFKPTNTNAKKTQKTHLKFEISVGVDCKYDLFKKEVNDFYEELNSIKKKLEISKNKIDPFFTMKNYQSIWGSLDLYAPLKRKLVADFGAQYVTNAWIKYWEIYCEFSVVSMPAVKSATKTAPVRIFCNAELPGASISAFNHYADTYGIPYDWRASSLSPSETQINKDTLGDYYGIWEKNREKWLMSSKREVGIYYNNGDCTDINNLNDFEKRIGINSDFGGVDIYSHDAGIEIAPTDYNRQEELNLRIHLGCALAGFMTLKKGGFFIAKQYTFFEPLSVELIALYSSMFEKFYIDKPQTSRPYNSEIYLIGVGFLGLGDDVRAKLSHKLENFDLTPIDPKYMDLCGALGAILDAAKIFVNQVEYVEEGVALLKAHINDKYYNFKKFANVSGALIDDWLRRYPIKKLQVPLLGNVQSSAKW